MPGTLVSAGDTAMERQGLCPGEVSVYLDKTDDKHISQEVNNYRN